jgi:hypothetical protein
VIEEHNTDGRAVASWLSRTSHWFQTTLINLYRVVFDDDGGLAANCVNVVRLCLDLGGRSSRESQGDDTDFCWSSICTS